MSCTLGDVPQNLEKACHYIEEAGREGADLICLPELFATGYNLGILADEIQSLSLHWQETIHKEIATAAAKAGIWVIAPYGEAVGNTLYNAAVLYNRSGETEGRYHKTFAFEAERAYFANGDRYPVFETEFGTIGILICYDIGFPETARRLMQQGAEVIFMPSAWRVQDEHAWRLNVPSRAMENQLFTVGVNRCGLEGQLHLFGGSMVCDPWGRTVLQAENDRDALALCEIDLDDLARCRAEGGYLTDYRAI